MNAVWPIAVGYLFGSVPFAFLLSRKWRGIDIRSAGSGNVGATNVLRTSGVLTALTVVALDIAKGIGSVLVVQRFTSGDAAAAAAGLAAIVGHIYPVWLRFKGGKGVATACGVFSVLLPAATAAALALFVATVWLTRFVSLGSIVATVALGTIAWAMDAPRVVVGVSMAAAAVILFRHRSNLARLAAGTERRIGHRAS
jgi:acyl phosphate:glycerol-3-phosphate acyltransferase